MSSADGIRKHGFRSWYERQLIEGHAWFVTGFFCLILIAASLEHLQLRASVAEALLLIALVGGGLALCLLSLQRYRSALTRAEHLAEQSVCARCRAYGALRVVASGPDDPAAGPAWLRVSCRKCGHQWRMDEAE
jgi:ribosomal protein L40E